MLKMPALDDKSYRQLLNESLATIPLLTDKWTDFNPQDTGILLLELLAGMTEMQNYYLDQVGDRFYRKLLTPLLDSDSNQPINEMLSKLELERDTLRRAVTEEDYHTILMKQHQPDFKLDGVHVKINGRNVFISVWRKTNPLLPEELEKIRECLEKYRLLTTRVFVEQTKMAMGRENTDD